MLPSCTPSKSFNAPRIGDGDMIERIIIDTSEMSVKEINKIEGQLDLLGVDYEEE